MLKKVILTFQEWRDSLRVPTPVRNKKKYTRKTKHKNKSYLKVYELVEEGVIDPSQKVKSPKKAFRILVEYDIKDIREAVKIYDEQLSK